MTISHFWYSDSMLTDTEKLALINGKICKYTATRDTNHSLWNNAVYLGKGIIYSIDGFISTGYHCYRVIHSRALSTEWTLKQPAITTGFRVEKETQRIVIMCNVVTSDNALVGYISFVEFYADTLENVVRDNDIESDKLDIESDINDGDFDF